MPERRAALDPILTAASEADRLCRAQRESLEAEAEVLLRRVEANPDDRRAKGRLWTLVEEHRLATVRSRLASDEVAVAARALDAPLGAPGSR